MTEFVAEICENMLGDPRAMVNERTADQLLVYMALAEGTSKMTVCSLSEKHRSLHLQTQIELLKMFMPTLDIKSEQLSETVTTYEVTGIAFKN